MSKLFKSSETPEKNKNEKEVIRQLLELSRELQTTISVLNNKIDTLEKNYDDIKHDNDFKMSNVMQHLKDLEKKINENKESTTSQATFNIDSIDSSLLKKV